MHFDACDVVSVCICLMHLLYGVCSIVWCVCVYVQHAVEKMTALAPEVLRPIMEAVATDASVNRLK